MSANCLYDGMKISKVSADYITKYLMFVS